MLMFFALHVSKCRIGAPGKAIMYFPSVEPREPIDTSKIEKARSRYGVSTYRHFEEGVIHTKGHGVFSR